MGSIKSCFHRFILLILASVKKNLSLDYSYAKMLWRTHNCTLLSRLHNSMDRHFSDYLIWRQNLLWQHRDRLNGRMLNLIRWTRRVTIVWTRHWRVDRQWIWYGIPSMMMMMMNAARSTAARALIIRLSRAHGHRAVAVIRRVGVAIWTIIRFDTIWRYDIGYSSAFASVQ